MLILKGHNDRVRQLAFSPDSMTLASASGAGTRIWLWDLRDGSVRTRLRGHRQRVERLVFSPKGTTLASADGRGDVKLWDTATGQKRDLPRKHHYSQELAFSPDGGTLATLGRLKWLGGQGNAQGVSLLDVTTGKERARLPERPGAVLALAFAPDGRTLAVGSADNTVRLWDVITRRERTALSQRARPAVLAFAPDGRTLASASEDATVKLWGIDR